MLITRLYTGKKNDSFFEDVEIELKDSGSIGFLSKSFAVNDIIFRETSGDYDYDFHNAPKKQFIICLDGEIEIETSLGEKRRFKSGDIILAEDTAGKGHKTKSIDKKLRKSIFVTVN